jgi:hypothetical protein
MVTRTYEVRTHGCQMNMHESERIAGMLDEAGYAPVADGVQPGVVVFSTRAVRENADNKLAGKPWPPQAGQAPHTQLGEVTRKRAGRIAASRSTIATSIPACASRQ